MTGIADKIILITGASSGIGEATARELAAAGATVVLGARRTDRLEKLVDEIEAAGGRARAQALDVTAREDVQAFVDAARAAYGRIDVIINNAGVMPLSPMASLKVDEWARMNTLVHADPIENWGTKSGNTKRIRHLRRALEEFGGRVDVVIVSGEPGESYGTAQPWVAKDGRANTYWQITEFDAGTGHFEAVLVRQSQTARPIQ